MINVCAYSRWMNYSVDDFRCNCNRFSDLLFDLNSIGLGFYRYNGMSHSDCLKCNKELIGKLNIIFGKYLMEGIQGKYNKKDIDQFNKKLVKIMDSYIKRYKPGNDDKNLITVNVENVHTLLAMFAVENGGGDIYRFLLEYPDEFKIDYGYKLEGDVGCTISHTVVAGGDSSLIKEVMLRAKVNQFMILNNKGRTPLGLLIKYGKDADAYYRMLEIVEHEVSFSKSDINYFESACKYNKENRKEFLKLLFSGKDRKIDPFFLRFGLLHDLGDEFVQEITDEETYKYYKLSNYVHLLEVLLDVGSGNYSDFVRKEVAEYIRQFTDTINDESLNEGLLRIIKALEGLNLSKDFSDDFSDGEVLFDNNLRRHARYGFLSEGNGEHVVTIVDGGSCGITIKQKQEKSQIGMAFKNESNVKKKLRMYGVVQVTLNGEIEEIKKKIKEAIKKQVRIEEVLQEYFEPIVSKEEALLFEDRQEDGSCAGFSLLLLLKYQFAKLELILENKDVEKEVDFKEKLKERMVKEDNLFSKVIQFVYAQIVDKIVTQCKTMDFDSLEEKKPERYDTVLSAVKRCSNGLYEIKERKISNELYAAFPY